LASRDYYSVLQVNPSATQEQIEAAYARLSRLYDPATSRKRKAAQRRREVEAAYEVLSDRQRRAEYDRLRAKGWRPGQPLPRSALPATGLRGFLANPYVFSGLAAGGVLAVLVAVIVASVLSGEGSESAVSGLPTVTPAGSPTPTLPPQTPTAPPTSPPPVEGEEITNPSGLRYIDVVEGTGDFPLPGDTIVVNYTGWLESDGTMFDSSLDDPQPFSFVLGRGQVIKGWDEGVGSMREGGTRRLIIPPSLAYGETGSGNIPPNATLIFDVTVVDIFHVLPLPTPTPTPTPPTETAPAAASPSP
jgi:peptidylprolyl isomerase